jgi:NADH-quinone oxidoreductase subunit H
MVSILFVLSFVVSILAESNRVPFDLLEAESELVAGFITEMSSIYFSFIILTEYANIITLSFLVIFLLDFFVSIILFFLFFVCLIRCSFNRFKFDELMSLS